eukprot:scaffold161938_cov44-Attheya_sp.AAC.2
MYSFIPVTNVAAFNYPETFKTLPGINKANKDRACFRQTLATLSFEYDDVFNIPSEEECDWNDAEKRATTEADYKLKLYRVLSAHRPNEIQMNQDPDAVPGWGAPVIGEEALRRYATAYRVHKARMEKKNEDVDTEFWPAVPKEMQKQFNEDDDKDIEGDSDDQLSIRYLQFSQCG